MSHTTSLKSIIIRDVSALHAAARELAEQGVPCKLLENAKPRMYYRDQHGNCEYVLNLSGGQYDVGFEKQADGTYVPVFDEWGNHVSGQIGASCPMPDTPEGRAQHQIGKYMQLYAKHAAINLATEQGYIVEGSTYDNEGNIQLELSVV